MKRSRFSDEQIIGILKEHQVGLSAAELCRKYGISDATFYTWRKKYGGMEVSEARRLKALEEENARLKKLLAELMMDVSTLREMLGKKLAGVTAALGDAIELARDPLAGQRVVDDRRQALPAEVVDDGQDAEAPTVDERVGDEVEAPALVGILRHRLGALVPSARLRPPRAHRQPLLAVEPVELLAVHGDSLPLSRMCSRR